MKKNKIVIPGANFLVASLSDAIQKSLTGQGYDIKIHDMAGHGRNFLVRKGNFLLGFFGCNRSVKLSIYTQNEDLAVDLRWSLLGSHITLLVLLLLMLPPFHIGIIFALTPLGWIFILAHIVGLITQLHFLKKMRSFIPEYCEKNVSAPCYCPQCGNRLNVHGTCDNCKEAKKNSGYVTFFL